MKPIIYALCALLLSIEVIELIDPSEPRAILLAFGATLIIVLAVFGLTVTKE